MNQHFSVPYFHNNKLQESVFRDSDRSIRGRRKFCFNIHTPVQNPDDLNLIISFLTIKDNMATDSNLPVAMPNIATISSLGRACSQLLKTAIQHGEIFISRLIPLTLLSVAANIYQVGHCPLRQNELGHLTRLSLSSESINPERE